MLLQDEILDSVSRAEQAERAAAAFHEHARVGRW